MIINKEIISLIKKIKDSPNTLEYFKEFIQVLNQNCINNTYKPTSINLEKYPVGLYAEAIDPLKDEEKLLDYFSSFGFVVAKNILNTQETNQSLISILNIIKKIDLKFEDESTWLKDSNNIPIISRGFFEVYHDNMLAQIRQNINLYLYHVLLWNTPFLWTTFDRIGIKITKNIESKGLQLHVDQNPSVHPDFRTIQGVLALSDCPIERGTFSVVPKSSQYFKEYLKFIKDDYKGEFVELPINSDLYKKIICNQQAIPLQSGNIVSWDSRTTHANTDNFSSENRYVVYISTGLAKNNNDLITHRKNSYETGLGLNIRDAYMHASKKPRFTNSELINKIREPEELTLLGECLYGFKKYGDFL
jgi:ectoine hydroxylase-related dioxygenase (phytanoyl-CoA dioxygenase family)